MADETCAVLSTSENTNARAEGSRPDTEAGADDGEVSYWTVSGNAILHVEGSDDGNDPPGTETAAESDTCQPADKAATSREEPSSANDLTPSETNTSELGVEVDKDGTDQNSVHSSDENTSEESPSSKYKMSLLPRKDPVVKAVKQSRLDAISNRLKQLQDEKTKSGDGDGENGITSEESFVVPEDLPPGTVVVQPADVPLEDAESKNKGEDAERADTQNGDVDNDSEHSSVIIEDTVSANVSQNQNNNNEHHTDINDKDRNNKVNDNSAVNSTTRSPKDWSKTVDDFADIAAAFDLGSNTNEGPRMNQEGALVSGEQGVPSKTIFPLSVKTNTAQTIAQKNDSVTQHLAISPAIQPTNVVKPYSSGAAKPALRVPIILQRGQNKVTPNTPKVISPPQFQIQQPGLSSGQAGPTIMFGSVTSGGGNNLFQTVHTGGSPTVQQTTQQQPFKVVQQGNNIVIPMPKNLRNQSIVIRNGNTDIIIQSEQIIVQNNMGQANKGGVVVQQPQQQDQQVQQQLQAQQQLQIQLQQQQMQQQQIQLRHQLQQQVPTQQYVAAKPVVVQPQQLKIPLQHYNTVQTGQLTGGVSLLQQQQQQPDSIKTYPVFVPQSSSTVVQQPLQTAADVQQHQPTPVSVRPSNVNVQRPPPPQQQQQQQQITQDPNASYSNILLNVLKASQQTPPTAVPMSMFQPMTTSTVKNTFKNDQVLTDYFGETGQEVKGKLLKVPSTSKNQTVIFGTSIVKQPVKLSETATSESIESSLVKNSVDSGVKQQSAEQNAPIIAKTVFKCDKCTRLFATEKAFRKHAESCIESESGHDDISQQYSCEFCNEKFAYQSSLVLHQQSSCKNATKKTQANPFICTRCHKKFSSVSELGSHYKNVHEHSTNKETTIEQNNAKPVNVAESDSVVSNKEDSVTTAENVEVDDADQGNDNSENSSKKQTNSATKKYECYHCSRQFVYHSPFMSHVNECKVIHAAAAEKKQEAAKKQVKVKHEEYVDEEYDEDEPRLITDRETRTKVVLAKHGKIDKKRSRPFVCKICGKDYGSEHCLYEHLKTHIKPYRCSVCNWRSSRKDNVVRHIYRQHKGPKYLPRSERSSKGNRQPFIKEENQIPDEEEETIPQEDDNNQNKSSGKGDVDAHADDNEDETMEESKEEDLLEADPDETIADKQTEDDLVMVCETSETETHHLDKDEEVDETGDANKSDVSKDQEESDSTQQRKDHLKDTDLGGDGMTKGNSVPDEGKKDKTVFMTLDDINQQSKHQKLESDKNANPEEDRASSGSDITETSSNFAEKISEKPRSAEVSGKETYPSLYLAQTLVLDISDEGDMTTAASKKAFPYAQKDFTVSIERPFPCTLCGKAFKRKNNLNDHILSHTKPFRCPECNWATTRKQYLAGHLVEKHGQTNVDKDSLIPIEVDLETLRVEGDTPRVPNRVPNMSSTESGLVDFYGAVNGNEVEEQTSKPPQGSNKRKSFSPIKNSSPKRQRVEDIEEGSGKELEHQAGNTEGQPGVKVSTIQQETTPPTPVTPTERGSLHTLLHIGSSGSNQTTEQTRKEYTQKMNVEPPSHPVSINEQSHYPSLLSYGTPESQGITNNDVPEQQITYTSTPMSQLVTTVNNINNAAPFGMNHNTSVPHELQINIPQGLNNNAPPVLNTTVPPVLQNNMHHPQINSNIAPGMMSPINSQPLPVQHYVYPSAQHTSPRMAPQTFMPQIITGPNANMSHVSPPTLSPHGWAGAASNGLGIHEQQSMHQTVNSYQSTQRPMAQTFVPQILHPPTEYQTQAGHQLSNEFSYSQQNQQTNRQSTVEQWHPQQTNHSVPISSQSSMDADSSFNGEQVPLAKYYKKLDDAYDPVTGHNRPFMCTYNDCNKRLKTMHNLREHIYTHIRPYPCDVCGLQFARTDYLGIHMFKVHNVALSDDDLYRKRKLANDKAVKTIKPKNRTSISGGMAQTGDETSNSPEVTMTVLQQADGISLLVKNEPEDTSYQQQY